MASEAEYGGVTATSACRNPSSRLAPGIRQALLASDRPIVILGPTSKLGRAALAILDASLSDTEAKRILVLGASERWISLPSGRRIFCTRLADSSRLPGSPLVLHCSHISERLIEQLGETGFLALNRSLNDHVLQLMLSAGGSLFYASCSAVYRSSGKLVSDPSEGVFGYARLQNEARFIGGAQGRYAVATARIFDLAWPVWTAPAADTLTGMIDAIRRGDPIRLDSGSSQWRSYAYAYAYAYAGDVVNLALTELLADCIDPTPFEAGSEQPLEVGELAELCRQVLGVPQHPIERPACDGGCSGGILPNTTDYRARLARAGLLETSIERQILAAAGCAPDGPTVSALKAAS